MHRVPNGVILPLHASLSCTACCNGVILLSNTCALPCECPCRVPCQTRRNPRQQHHLVLLQPLLQQAVNLCAYVDQCAYSTDPTGTGLSCLAPINPILTLAAPLASDVPPEATGRKARRAGLHIFGAGALGNDRMLCTRGSLDAVGFDVLIPAVSLFTCVCRLWDTSWTTLAFRPSRER